MTAAARLPSTPQPLWPYFLAREIWRYGIEANNWTVGSEAEEQVAAELELLREQGWVIVHNLKRDGRGNLDHFVSFPPKAFAIETKSGKYRATDRGQAISNAIWAKKKFGLRYVEAVLCVGQEPPSEPHTVRHGNSTVWVVGHAQLQPWLLAQTPRGSGMRTPG